MTPIIVIRPEPGSSATVTAAQKIGLKVQGFPLFKVVPRRWVPPPADTVDALLLGSANALRHGGENVARYVGKPAYVVGESTAEAALLARAVPGQPVQVVWSREDELGVAPFGPAMHVELSASLGADGRIENWKHEVWSNGHGLRPGRGTSPVLLPGTLLARPFERQVSVNPPLTSGGGAPR